MSIRGAVPSARMRVDLLREKGIKYISGKWFKKDGEEIINIKAYMYAVPELDIRSLKDITDTIDLFIGVYGDYMGWWPEMKIVKEAKEKAVLEPLAFPLDEYQLMIINRLIYGRDEMMFILTGIGGSGKSTFINIIRQIFGNDSASLSLSDLCNDFMLANGANKRLISSDELDSDDLRNSRIKTLISKQPITVNPKFQCPVDIRWQGSMVFSCNKPPKLDISDSGLLRRICYYCMNKKITNPDPTMKDKVFSHNELVNIVAHALKMDTKDWFLTFFQQDTRKVLMESNNVFKTKADTYEDYKTACFKSNYRPYSIDNWENIHDLFKEWEEEEDLPF